MKTAILIFTAALAAGIAYGATPPTKPDTGCSVTEITRTIVIPFHHFTTIAARPAAVAKLITARIAETKAVKIAKPKAVKAKKCKRGRTRNKHGVCGRWK